jgi:hypothetical protein
MEKLLWLPPSKPYYKPSGIFSKGNDLSKTLVFSSWEMIPRMIACMLSYEAERLNCKKLNEDKDAKPKRYFAEESKRRTVTIRLKDEMESIITYPCRTLNELYNPLEYIDRSLDFIQKGVGKKVRELLRQVKEQYRLGSGRGGAKDIFLLMQLMDGQNSEMPSVLPNGIESLLTNIAIASPAVCAYRMFAGCEQREKLAMDLAGGFVSLFNKPESMDILDVVYRKDDDFYYEDVMEYCAEGNLQAVLDEWAYVLGFEGETLLTAMKTAFIGTRSVRVDTYESFAKQAQKPNMRNHFAVGYFNTRLDDQTVQSTENIRSAFNSPFRPFVLATTSIGQEGLDFHLYCRKICHWNLPSNPVDLEQREGRINRYLCLAIRQSIARRYGEIGFEKNIWDEMFNKASETEKQGYSDLVPFWCLPDDNEDVVKIERIVPMYPLSKDRLVYERLVKVLTLYRLTLGQPRQEELLDNIHAAGLDEGSLDELFLDLSPWNRDERKARVIT